MDNRNPIITSNLNESVVVIYAMIEGFKGSHEEIIFNPLEKTKQRVKNLGLDIISTEIRWDMNNSGDPKAFIKIEKSLWKKASNLKEHIFKYSKNDFSNALNFLELFCIYAEALNNKTKINTELKDIDLYERFPEGGGFVTKYRYDSTVYKAIKLIEDINDSLESSFNKSDKQIIKRKLERLHDKINKIFINDLSITAQKALVKKIKKAEKILNKLV